MSRRKTRGTHEEDGREGEEVAADGDAKSNTESLKKVQKELVKISLRKRKGYWTFREKATSVKKRASRARLVSESTTL